MARSISDSNLGVTGVIEKGLAEIDARDRSKLGHRLHEFEANPGDVRARVFLKNALRETGPQIERAIQMHARLKATGRSDAKAAALEILERLGREAQRRDPSLSKEQAFAKAAGSREGREIYNAMRRWQGQTVDEIQAEHRRLSDTIGRALKALADS